MQTSTLIAVAALLLAVALSASATKPMEAVTRAYTFDQYRADFGKQYSQKEMHMRERLFKQRLAEVIAHNAEADAGRRTWRKAINKFSAHTDKELRSMSGNKRISSKLLSVAPQPHEHTGVEIPASYDWRAVTPNVLSAVKDQGQCGSCWAFASTEALESAYALLTGQLPDASPQHILQAPNPEQCGGTGGCQGGTASVAYAYLISQGGQASIFTMPYLSYFGQNFPAVNSSQVTTPVTYLSGYVELPINEETPLLDAVANVGPVTVSVDASAWSSYSSGIFDGCVANATIDHAVVMVGYSQDSYIIRNSWGAAWGEDGYIRLARPSTPVCGTDPQPSDGVGCKDGPTELPVCGTCGVLSSSVYPVATTAPEL